MLPWQCPVCAGVLQSDATGWHCSLLHQFDQAKEGYTNLLLANQKRKPDPGDNRAMLTARRRFLDAGFYQPLAQSIVDLLGRRAEPGLLLDVGCGEGYYLQFMLEKLSTWQGGGIDISREALRLAAKRSMARAELAVASSKRIPIMSGSVDCVLCVFAPYDSVEIARVLKPDASLIVVTPGPKHLQALKAHIYQDARDHAAATTPAGFHLAHQQAIQFPMVFAESASLANLLAMTPFVYRLSEEKRAQLLSLRNVEVQAEFCISVYRPEVPLDC